MFLDTANTIIAKTLPKAPEGCYWSVDDHQAEPHITVELYRNFLSVGATLIQSQTEHIDADHYDCPTSLQHAKYTIAYGLAQHILDALD